MALSIDATYKGLAAPNTYTVISSLTINPDKAGMSYMVLYKAACDQPSYEASSFASEYDLEGENPFKQAYEYLKLLPEFKGCTDC